MASAAAAWLPTATAYACCSSSAGAASWQPTAAALPAPMPGYTIVLCRRSEFSPATGAPTEWKPAAGYGYGTARLSRELGIGELLTYDRIKQASPESLQNACGMNLFGGVLDFSETVQILTVVSLLDEGEEPDTGDFFEVEGRTFIISRVQVHSEAGTERSMTLNGIRWNGLTQYKLRDREFDPPALANA